MKRIRVFPKDLMKIKKPKGSNPTEEPTIDKPQQEDKIKSFLDKYSVEGSKPSYEKKLKQNKAKSIVKKLTQSIGMGSIVETDKKLTKLLTKKLMNDIAKLTNLNEKN